MKQAWISNFSWVYSTKFDLPSSSINNYQLIFESIDTIAGIWLNGEEIGETENEFRYFVFDLVKEKVKEKGNLLEIRLESSLKYAH